MTSAEQAAAAFRLGGPVTSVETHPTGHINDAYLVTTGCGRFLLQRLNPAVFADADAVMSNVVAVTDHLRRKGEPTLTLVPAIAGGVSWRDDDGAVWRTYEYVEGVHAFAVHSPADAAVVGRAFGRFHRFVEDLDPTLLRVSLPGFHDPVRRVAQLQQAANDDPCDRGGGARDLIDALLAVPIPRVLDDLPVRVAHYDAKAANLLVGSSVVVVDLDTVMPGSILWDLGDMVRSSTGTSEEATATVSFDRRRYDSVVGAWLDEVDDLLTDDERDAVPAAGSLVTFEQAVRFLTDHLRGDVYFRVTTPDENLRRAQNQFDLLCSMRSAL